MPNFIARPQRFLNPLKRPRLYAARARLSKLLTGRQAADLDVLSKRIILPSLPSADEDMTRLSIIENGRRLARQDRWDDFSSLIRLADDARLSTPGGCAEAILLVLGAHGDVVAAAEDALNDGRAPGGDGLAALDEVAHDAPESYPCALVSAMAHLQVARAWRITKSAAQAGDPVTHARRHCTAARDRLAEFDAMRAETPSLATAACMLAERSGDAPARIIGAHMHLIRLDPRNLLNMRKFGRLLLPRASGNFELLDDHATRLAAQTQDIWGNGAYVWVWIDALKVDPAGLGHVDAQRFTDGLHDILCDTANQHVVNDLAAFCARAMAPEHTGPLSRPAEKSRARLHACQDWIFARHLHELHPCLWSEVDQTASAFRKAPAHRALVTQGRKAALRVIAQRFADQMADGSSIAFSPAGMYRLPANC